MRRKAECRAFNAWATFRHVALLSDAKVLLDVQQKERRNDRRRERRRAQSGWYGPGF